MQNQEEKFRAAVAAHMDKQYAQAEQDYLAILATDGRSVPALMHYGILLAQTGRAAEAYEKLSAALKITPNDVALMNNLGRLLLDMEQLDQAETMFRKAMARDRNNALSLGHIALTKARKSDFAAAAQWYRRALEQDGSADWIRYNYALNLLGSGNFEEAWPLHESRFSEQWPERPVQAPKIPFPRWQGEAIDGKSIVVLCEQGHGDEIQLIRYAAHLKTLRARKVTWLCKPPLASLFASIEGIQVLPFAAGMAIEVHDYWVMAMSLPYCCRTTLATIPSARESYLPRVRGGKLPALQDGAGLYKVGLAWQGSKGLRNDRHRSLSDLAPLLVLGEIAGVRLYSLQKGEAEDQARAAAHLGKLVHLGDSIENFNDTALLIQQLDLVITVDTAVAHLAGALGKPAWVMLPFAGIDWRWLHQGEQTPWYGNMRLFRQPRPGDNWPLVIAQIARQLRLTVDQRNAANLPG
ncbi:tetratricopeptide repeat protein [Collimonas sp.]|jgi:Flp pilus assembly protein TadD|uniref:tetratricopeptide repeat-containing glycosyltransferase family protein n=1 Tax=Collimonas sp. TaxID=1963772 RepID=UPI002C9A2CD7|nr:tetratricopeptide repeat protein [Collimonas sp.]HWW99201.1 tetratricopeptide repeat protein [Collimonas sp.]